MRQFATSLVLLLAVAAAIVALMPRAWIAEPVSSEPRSMMGSGFVNDHADVGPWTWWWSRHLDLRVDHPSETNIIIWNHHTEAMVGAPSCLGKLYYPPPSIMALEQIGRTRVYYLCTRSTQHPDKPFYALQRRDEILELVGRFRDLGVPAERIFLSGQSGGSCASLYALGAAHDQMNAGILFSPACYGRTEGQRRSLGMLSKRAQDLDRQLLAAESVTALLVAFKADGWNKPQDLDFLTAKWPGTVELFSPGCGADHSGAFYGCGIDAVAGAVRTYYLRQLAGRGVEVPLGG